MDTHCERQELIKFFKCGHVHGFSNMSMKMPSCRVDSYWHQILSSQTDYQSILKQAGIDQPLTHRASGGFDKIDWVETYHKLFGQLPVCWFQKEDGSIDQQALDRYNETGELWASWDCDPLGYEKHDQQRKDETQSQRA